MAISYFNETQAVHYHIVPITFSGAYCSLYPTHTHHGGDGVYNHMCLLDWQFKVKCKWKGVKISCDDTINC